MKNAKRENGFSLIELLIVVAIILIIAAIAVPNLLKSKMAANEASAAAAARVVGTAEVSYSSTYNTGFSPSLGALGPPTTGSATSLAADLLDSVLSGAVTSATATSSTKSGYNFSYTVPGTSPAATFSIVGTPVASGSTGQSKFCLDQTNVVRKDPTGTVAAPGAATGCATTVTPM